MMDMNKVLEKYQATEDWKLMDEFLNRYACRPYNGIEYLLDWYDAKNQFLFKLFGDKLIVDCGDICFKKSDEDLVSDFNGNYSLKADMWAARDILDKIIGKCFVDPNNQEYYSRVFSDYDTSEYCRTVLDCLQADYILKNGSHQCKEKGRFFGKNEFIHIHRFERPRRILDNFFKVVEKVYPQEFTAEIARAKTLIASIFATINNYVATSRVWGRLKLSIHPFDYITMSENSLDWDSCMAFGCQFDDELGDYCAGTIALMNSPNAIIAYLEASTPFYPLKNCFGANKEVADMAWNNKKYRNVFVIDPMIITGIRGYPYENFSIDEAILNELIKLAKENLGWDFNKDILTHRLGTNKKTRVDKDGKPIYLTTEKMYNDSNNHEAVFVTGKMNVPSDTLVEIDGDKWFLKYDATVYCLDCGSPLEDSYQPLCLECRGMFRCDECGDIFATEDIHEFEGRYFCYCCYDNNFSHCNSCNTYVPINRSENGEVVHSEIYYIKEYLDFFDKSIPVYQERLEKYKKTIGKYPDEYFIYPPRYPDRFTIITHEAFLCKNCLENAIKDGYVVFKQGVYASPNAPKWRDCQGFFITNKGFESEEFLEQLDLWICSSSLHQNIGIETYFERFKETPVLEVVSNF